MAMRRPDGEPRESRANGLLRIEAEIRQRLGGQVRDLQVTIQDDGVILRGRARTHHARQVVLQVVLDLTDLPIRSNEIRAGIRAWSSEPRSVKSPAEPCRDQALPERLR